MYKIHQVAHMLGVSTVDIHSQLIEQRDQFQDHIHKKVGIQHIDAEGVKLLARLLEPKTFEAISHEIQESTVEPSTQTAPDEQPDLDPEMQIFVLREKVSRLKAQITRLDQEILLKDEAIEHYLQSLVAKK